MEPLAFDRTGSGPPLALIHPLGAHRGVWKPVLPLLAGHFDVVAVDMPGFGDSAELPADMPAGAANIAAAVRHTLASIGIERAHVAGISLGGWTALEFGKTASALSVTALCAAGFWNRVLGPRPEIGRTTARRLLPLLRGLVRSAGGRRAVLGTVMAHPEKVPAADAWALVRNYARSPGFTRANTEMRGSLFEGFDQIHVPVTMAWADHDRSVYPPRSVPPGIEVRALRDCGHVCTWDSPEQVATVIREGAGRALAASA